MKRLIVSIILLFTHTCFGLQTLVWDSTPINIEVPVSSGSHVKELQVHFPTTVQFGLPTALQDKLHVVNANQTLYLSADSDFAMVPNVMVKTLDHKVILLNVSATNNARAGQINIVYKNSASKSAQSVSTGQNDTDERSEVSIEKLMRYSIQQLYAPKRLLKTVPGIQELQIFNGKTYDLIPDGSLTAMPLSSYAGGGKVITAVLVRNNLKIPVDIRAQMICGHWIGFAPFPNSRLLPRGEHGDSTTLFLISRSDFNSVFDGGCK